jgi:hypothetical protein
MAVISANYELEKGTDFIQSFTFTNSDRSPLNLVGYTASAKIRKYPTSPPFNTITIQFVNRLEGRVNLLIDKEETAILSAGRNYYDLFLTDPDGISTKFVEGSIIVNESSTLGYSPPKSIDGLGTVDVSNLNDGYVLMFDAPSQSFVFVNPDEVLSQAATDQISPGLPSDFIDELDAELDNRINLDAGTW